MSGVQLFSYIGAAPPADASAWKFEGFKTRAVNTVQFPADLAPGSVVWFTAFWQNPRGETGPGCAPLSAIIAGGALAEAA